MSCGKNTFSDISKCQNLPLDNAFQNKKGGGGVAQNAIKVLNEMINEGSQGLLSKVDVKSVLNLLQKGGKKTRSKRRRRRSKRRSQRGGRESNGYYLAVGENSIGGRAEVISYDTCNTPKFPVNCRGLRGGKISKRRPKRRTKRRTKRRPRRINAIKKRRTKKRTRSRSRRRMRGGNDPYKYRGLPGNFSPDMSTRQFGCRAPYWLPKCT
jgi:hypothetical protein